AKNPDFPGRWAGPAPRNRHLFSVSLIGNTSIFVTGDNEIRECTARKKNSLHLGRRHREAFEVRLPQETPHIPAIAARRAFTPGQSQSGSALIVSMLILLVLTVIGVSGANQSILQERMASNTKRQTTALFAADSGAVAISSFLKEDWNLSKCPPQEDLENLAQDEYPFTLENINCHETGGIKYLDATIAGYPAHSNPNTETSVRRIEARFILSDNNSPLASAADAAYTCFGQGCTIDFRGQPGRFLGYDHSVPDDLPGGNPGDDSFSYQNNVPENKVGLLMPGDGGVLDPGTGNSGNAGNPGNPGGGGGGSPDGSIHSPS
ncbi:PilX N-terminal domain-containing pilus assembly protein, partial [Arhodomonas sp. SL1]|uniref:PilX N-terminal domain-containing pilus assembly protein n=1 Tax=Arhodomonas sp. SL1 TaxID=3425691 RepID=UPI003F885CE5